MDQGQELVWFESQAHNTQWVLVAFAALLWVMIVQH